MSSLSFRGDPGLRVRASDLVLLISLAAAAASLGCAGAGGGEPPRSPSAATHAPSTTPASAGAQPEPSEPAPTKSIIGVIAVEVRSRAEDGSIQQGEQLEHAPYEAVFQRVEREIAECVGSGGERALGVDVAPTGTVSAVESIKDVPPCLPPIIRTLTFPARSLPVVLTVVVSP